ncbi:DNA primase small subunit domain-containing protein [Streptomyces sp. LN245]|uniref:non-homologous end-joining DNA ligase LigD n=1 Tax=Streptomyces sp. LN245 TaxID=3112975 RepID=UPI003715E501
MLFPDDGITKADRPDHPDRLIFDLDPPGDDFASVRAAALLLRESLEQLRLPSAVMATGSRGLHVLVPLDRSESFDDVRAFAADVAGLLAAGHPGSLTTEVRKEAREKRLYLDIQRNAYAQTAVAPFAVRARPGAPVAAPVSWTEVEDGDIGARSFTLRDISARLEDNPWQDAFRRGRSLGGARRRLDRLR